MYLWNLQGELLQEFLHGNFVFHAEFSPAGDRIFTGSRDGKARVWNLQGEVVHELHPASLVASFDPDSMLDIVQHGRFIDDGNIVLGCGSRVVVVWESTVQRYRRFDRP